MATHPPRQTPSETTLEILNARAANPERSMTEIAHAVGVHRQTVARLLARWAPVVEQLRELQRDQLVSAFQFHTFKALEKIDEADKQSEDLLADAREKQDPKGLAEALRLRLSAKDRQALMTTAAIGADKVLLLTGQPTTIGVLTHEHRVLLPGLVERIRAARALAGPQAAFPAPSDTRSGPPEA